MLAFDDTSDLSKFLFNAYIHSDRIENDPETAMANPEAQVIAEQVGAAGISDIEKIGTVCERILSYGISFIFSVLEDPNIWKSDFMGFEDVAEVQEETKGEDPLAAEKYAQNVLFSEANAMKIFSALTRKYLVYTNEEIEQWKEDSLKFYLHARNESNEIKGNFLREKAQRLLAGTQLRLDAHFEAFCTQVATELQTIPAMAGAPIEQQIQKDTMMQILYQRLASQEEVKTDYMISMIEAEL